MDNRNSYLSRYIFHSSLIKRLMIRFAQPSDAKKLLEIYAPNVIDSPVSFELSVPEPAEFESRIAKITQLYPWLVFEKDNEPIGYAYATGFRERAAYDWCAESTVYVNENYKRMGVATQLYQKLFSFLKYQGIINTYAVITLPNEESVALHEKMGYRHMATFDNAGYKLGQWWNVGWWQIALNPHSPLPNEIIRFSDIRTDIKSVIMNGKH